MADGRGAGRPLGVDLVESDRGGDVTYHGPGQLVAYPILRLADHGFTVSSYVHWLERAVVDGATPTSACRPTSTRPPWACGPTVPPDRPPAKVCAIGVRIRRGVTMHGLALNVTTDLSRLRPDRPLRVGRPAGHVPAAKNSASGPRRWPPRRPSWSAACRAGLAQPSHDRHRTSARRTQTTSDPTNRCDPCSLPGHCRIVASAKGRTGAAPR